MQVYNLISSIRNHQPILKFTFSPLDLLRVCAISTPRKAYSPAAIWGAVRGTHLHLSQERHMRVKCFAQRHKNYNVSILRAEINDISVKLLHQLGLETARQAATLAKRNAATIALL